MKPKELREYFRGLSYDERREFLRRADIDDLCALLDVQPEPTHDPYQRFRDAIRDGKRVFTYAVNGWMIPCSFGPEIYKPDELFIEGIDIPMQPTPEWLGRNGVELMGECRIPKAGEQWAGARCVFNYGDLYNPKKFSGRRWIVSPKAKKKLELERCEIVACGNILTCGGVVNISAASSCANFAGYEYEDGTVWVTPWRIVVSPFVGEKDKLERAKYILFRRNT